MNPGRPSFAEIGLPLILLTAVFFFGAVYSWGTMLVCALIFFLTFCFPQTVFDRSMLSHGWFWGGAILLVLIGLQSFFWSRVSHESIGVFLFWLAAACAFLWIQQFSAPGIYFFFFVFIAIASFESIYGAYEVFSGHEKVLWQVKSAYQGYLTGTFINRNHLAGFLEMALGVHLGCLCLAFKTRRLGRVAILLILLVIHLFAFLETGSRGGFLSFGLSLFLSMLLFIRLEGKRAWWGFLVVLGIWGGMFLVAGQGVWARFFDPTINFQSWNFERIYLWRDTLRLFQDYPWQGIGLGSFEWIFPFYQSGQLVWKYSHAHNDYLELLASLGAPVFGLLGVLFATGWGKLLKSLWNREIRAEGPLLLGGFIGLNAFLIHGLFDFNFAIPANGLAFLMLFSALLRLCRGERQDA